MPSCQRSISTAVRGLSHLAGIQGLRTSGESPAVLPASRCSGLRLWCEGLRGADKPCQGPLPPTALGMEKGLCYGVRSQQRRGGACTLTSVLAKSKFYLVRKEGGQSQTLELLSSWRRHNRTTTTRPHALLGEPARGEGPTRGELARWPCAGVTEACCSDVHWEEERREWQRGFAPFGQ